MNPTTTALHVAVMGVTGAGKTTMAQALAAALDVAYIDADDLHPASNVKKMSAGVPLDEGEAGITIEATGSVDELVSAIVARLPDEARIGVES